MSCGPVIVLCCISGAARQGEPGRPTWHGGSAEKKARGVSPVRTALVRLRTLRRLEGAGKQTHRVMGCQYGKRVGGVAAMPKPPARAPGGSIFVELFVRAKSSPPEASCARRAKEKLRRSRQESPSPAWQKKTFAELDKKASPSYEKEPHAKVTGKLPLHKASLESYSPER